MQVRCESTDFLLHYIKKFDLTFKTQLHDVLPTALLAAQVKIPASSTKVSRISRQVVFPSKVISKSRELSIRAPSKKNSKLFRVNCPIMIFSNEFRMI